MTASCTERAWTFFVPFISWDLLDHVIWRLIRASSLCTAKVRAGPMAPIGRQTVSVWGKRRSPLGRDDVRAVDSLTVGSLRG